jgi:hypothetical protein
MLQNQIEVSRSSKKTETLEQLAADFGGTLSAVELLSIYLIPYSLARIPASFVIWYSVTVVVESHQLELWSFSKRFRLWK